MFVAKTRLATWVVATGLASLGACNPDDDHLPPQKPGGQDHGHGQHGDGDEHDGHTGHTDHDGGHGNTLDPYLCTQDVLSMDAPIVADTAVGQSRVAMCHPGAIGPEIGYDFVAPAAGFYRFSVNADVPGFDPLLGVIKGGADCSGDLIACADDRARAQQGDGDDNDEGAMLHHLPQVGTFLSEGEPVIVIVDSKSFDSSPFALDVEHLPAETCPDDILDAETTLPLSLAGTTLGETNSLTGTCFGTAGDRQIQWTAPIDGQFVISTKGSAALGHPDTLLYVLDGGCDGDELACSDDSDGGLNIDAEVTVRLVAEQTVTIGVDGWLNSEGPFVLTIRADDSRTYHQ